MSNERETKELCMSFNQFIIEATHVQKKYAFIIQERNRISSYLQNATLIHKYISTPSGTASTIAGIFLLVLTLIRTLCSVIQVV